MTTHKSNKSPILGEIVSVEAWHEELGAKTQKAKLFVDVTFMEGMVGAEAESPVRFRLALDRAEIVVVIPEVEPVSYDRNSVSRDTKAVVAKKTITKVEKGRRSVKGGATVKAGATGVAAGMELGGSIAGSSDETNSVRIAAEVALMNVEHALTPDRHNRWEITSEISDRLEGKPWPAVKKPRLTLIDERENPQSPLPPCVRVEVRCKRENLKISDIEIKERKDNASPFSFSLTSPNKMKAVEAYIRDRLSYQGLLYADVSEPFSELVIASVFADAIPANRK